MSGLLREVLETLGEYEGADGLTFTDILEECGTLQREDGNGWLRLKMVLAVLSMDGLIEERHDYGVDGKVLYIMTSEGENFFEDLKE